jgi:acyl CoA:acetate/3-ketoacid CoA transferase alpha subunit
MAATTTIAEVEEIVRVGSIGPENVMTPGIFVRRICHAKGIRYAN